MCRREKKLEKRSSPLALHFISCRLPLVDGENARPSPQKMDGMHHHWTRSRQSSTKVTHKSIHFPSPTHFLAVHAAQRSEMASTSVCNLNADANIIGRGWLPALADNYSANNPWTDNTPSAGNPSPHNPSPGNASEGSQHAFQPSARHLRIVCACTEPVGTPSGRANQ